MSQTTRVHMHIVQRSCEQNHKSVERLWLYMSNMPTSTLSVMASFAHIWNWIGVLPILGPENTNSIVPTLHLSQLHMWVMGNTCFLIITMELELKAWQCLFYVAVQVSNGSEPDFKTSGAWTSMWEKSLPKNNL